MPGRPQSAGRDDRGMGDEVMTRAELLATGLGRRGLAASLRSGAWIRVRRDRYASKATPTAIVEAVRVGGRLTCLSLLQLLGVFVFANDVRHIHLERGSSRLRAPDDPSVPFGRGRVGFRLHWMPLGRASDATLGRVAVVDALTHSVLCQSARHAVATLDSALNLMLIHDRDLQTIFQLLPARFAVLRGLVDGRSQSGPETLVRLMARALGCSIELQRWFNGVGFVDLVLDGWLVVECDSKEFHESWEQQVKDRARDLALARQGYAVLRLTAADIMYRPDAVLAALRGLIDDRRVAKR